ATASWPLIASERAPTSLAGDVEANTDRYPSGDGTTGTTRHGNTPGPSPATATCTPTASRPSTTPSATVAAKRAGPRPPLTATLRPPSPTPAATSDRSASAGS